MSKKSGQRCVHCRRAGAKLTVTRAGALCGRCMDHYPRWLRQPPRAEPRRDR